MSVKISVIVPCYNVEKYVDDCLKSLIEQTFNDLEIICVNDGSTDSTLGLLEKYSKKDERIKIITQENKGLSGARNTGIENSQGEYIAFLDADDWVDKNFYSELYNSIIKNDCDIAAATIIRKRKNSQKYRVFYKEEKIYSTLEEKLKICSIPKCCYVWNKLYKAELVKNNKFKEGVYFEDILWTPEILKQAKNLVTVPNVNHYYRVSSTSIVKKNSPKKQHDSYIAKKYIIKFFKENNIDLDKKSKTIVKEIKYFLNLPILKIKEYENKEKFYFLGFLPVHPKIYVFFKKIFSISYIDSHIMIYILGIQIRKKIKNFVPEIELKEKGTVDSYRKQKIILSLTTFPQRINTVSKTIKTLLNQTKKPDKVVLWLAESQFPNKENELPQDLLALKDFGLEIDWCEDIRSYKKLVPSVRKYPNDIIITFDDDIYYDNDIVENLYNAYLEYPNCICANRGHRVDIKNNQIVPKKNADLYWMRYIVPSYKNTIIGCGGVLYPPHCLDDRAMDEDKFFKIIPSQDDIWFWAMAVLKHTKIKIVSSYDMQLKTVDNTQQYGLCKINNSTKGISGKDGFKIISDNFREIIDIIKEENNIKG